MHCVHCRYYVFACSTGHKGTDEYEEIGECLLNPPILLNQSVSAEDAMEPYSWVQPIVWSDHEGCSHFTLDIAP